MPVLFDDDVVFEDEGGPRAMRAVNVWLRTLPSIGAPSPNSWRAYALAAGDWLMRLRRHCVAVFGTRHELMAALGTYADRRLSGPLDERLESSSWGSGSGKSTGTSPRRMRTAPLVSSM
ncbi:hypothetical protein J7E88_11305 [Streptomyces sp. ISL-10]|uniref:hypothetical protein n=1 Tax=Streptomyces sp. ISL-10 TaxID=2819172 RepID=UPI001BEA033E|nr:hypothetical protein [Streptomyces sp. ISL-10]MBT2365877.1 hypothetical protein [Streptomyces sp. ISL-10]